MTGHLHCRVILRNFVKMIRRIFSAIPKSVTPGLFPISCQSRTELYRCVTKPIMSQQTANFTSLLGTTNAVKFTSPFFTKNTKKTLLESTKASPEQIRTVTKFSLQKGKRKTVKTVTKRFFRLHWGIWIRRMAGHNRLYAKRKSRRHRLLSHMFCNATQSYMLDKMVNNFWRKPKHYIDDPYAVYHKREYFEMTRRKPWRPEGVDYE